MSLFSNPKDSLSRSEVFLLRFSQVVLGIFIIIFSINSFLSKNDDFLVFWNAGRHLLSGQPLYDFARDGYSCFKYPTWIAALFIPFALLPIEVAEVVWRLFSLCCMFWTCHWSVKGSQRPYLGILVFLVFWGTWMNNIVSGQVTPVLIALALWGYSELEKKKGLARFTIFISLSAKIFYLVAAIPLGRRMWNKKALTLISIFILLSTEAALPGYNGSLHSLFHAFISTTGSLSDFGVSGADYGLPTLWVKVFQISHLKHARVIGFLISLLIIFPWMTWFLPRKAADSERFCLGLALAAAIFPLQFSYGFIWAYPFVVFVVERVVERVVQRDIKKGLPLLIGAFTGISGLIFLDRFPLPFLEGLPVRALSIILMVIIWTFALKNTGSLESKSTKN
jgi:hypothetical protein